MTINSIETTYKQLYSEYEIVREELDRAQREFNKKYGLITKKAEPIVNDFTKRLFDYLVSKLNVSRSNYSETLSEIFLNDKKMQKISFHNHYYLSNPTGGFTYMIRDKNFKTEKGELITDGTAEEVGEWLLDRLYNFKK